MANIKTLDGDGAERFFQSDAAGTDLDPDLNVVHEVRDIQTPNDLNGATGSVAVGTTAQLGPNVPSNGVITIINLDAGNIYIGNVSLVSTDIVGAANAGIIPPNLPVPIEVENANQFVLGATNNGAMFTIIATRRV